MKVAQKCGLVFNAAKCFIKTPQIKFFGMVYDANGVHPDPEKCAEIQAISAPKNVTEIQQFLGIIEFMAPFISKLADQTAPLRALIKKDVPFEWKVFENVKASICKDIALTYFDVTKPTTIQVDASKIGIGAALLQDGTTDSLCQQSPDRDRAAVRQHRTRTPGCRFRLWTLPQTRLRKALCGWDWPQTPGDDPQEKPCQHSPTSTADVLRLQHYDVIIEYRPGKEMVLADSLSRLSPIPDKEIHLEQSIYAVQFTDDKLQQLKLESESDPEVTAIRNIITDGWPDSAKQLPKNLREFWSCRDELSAEDGLVLKGERVLIPPTMRNYILRNIHAGHQGMEKCKLRAKTCVYWKGINAANERTVNTCSVCQTNQSSQQAETLLPHDIPDGPWQVLATDIFHLDGNDYVIVVDYYSEMPFVRRLTSNSTSATVISALKQLFGEHGIPHKLLSDNGPQYDCVEFRTFAADWGFKHVTSSPRYPQSNGFAERMVQTVKKTMLKARQSSTDPDLSLLCLRTPPPPPPHRQQPPLPCRTPILPAAQIQPPSPLFPHTPRYSCPQEPASPPVDAKEVPWPESPWPSTTPHRPTCPPAGSQRDLDTSHCCREEARTAFIHRSHSKWWSLPS